MMKGLIVSQTSDQDQRRQESRQRHIGAVVVGAGMKRGKGCPPTSAFARMRPRT